MSVYKRKYPARLSEEFLVGVNFGKIDRLHKKRVGRRLTKQNERFNLSLNRPKKWEEPESLITMANRPYFKHGIEEIQKLVAVSHSDLKTLKGIQYELSFRTKPKARALKDEVDNLVNRLSAREVISPAQPLSSLPKSTKVQPLETSNSKARPLVPDRVVVECANCNTPNFVSTLEGVVQHLSCSACKSPYEAVFKYGVMRTTFQAKPSNDANSAPMRWVLIVLVALVILIFILMKDK